MAIHDLGKVVPEKGIDYFTQADKTEIQNAVETNLQSELANKELKANKTPIIDENSTEDQYPEAPAVYNKLVEQDEKIAELEEQNAMLIEQIPTATAEGNPINVQDSSNLPIKDFKLKGNCGKNLFDKNTMVQNGYINSSYKCVTSATTKTIKVPCQANKTYVLSKISTNRFRIGYITTEFEAGMYVSGGITDHTATNITITTGDNAKYLLAYIWEDGEYNLQEVLNSIQVEIGSTATEYEPYKDVTGDVTVVVNGKNLFDKTNITSSKRLAADGKVVSDSASNMWTSSFIKVIPNITYYKNSATEDAYHRVCFYSNNTENDFVSATNSNSFTTPNTCSYLRICGYNTELDSTQIEVGTTATAYEPYTEQTQLLSLGDTKLAPTDEISRVNGVWCINDTPITDTTLKGQLENIPNLHTYKNTTNISSTVPTGNIEPIYEITYYKDLETLLNDYETRIELLEA